MSDIFKVKIKFVNGDFIATDEKRKRIIKVSASDYKFLILNFKGRKVWGDINDISIIHSIIEYIKTSKISGKEQLKPLEDLIKPQS